MPVIALILIAELYIEQLLLFREWIVEVVGKVVALWLAVAVGYRCVCLVAILVEADTCLRVEEVVLLVDVQLLVLVAAVCLGDKFIVDTVGLVFYTAILQVGEGIPVVCKAIACLDEGAVVILVGIRIIVLILSVAAKELLLGILVGDISKVSPVVAAELLQVQSADNIPVLILVIGIVYHAVGMLGESLLADEVRLLDEITFCIIVNESELGKLGVVLELLVVAVAIGIMQ